jgi:hypothetical protein
VIRSWFFTPALLGVAESWRLARWCLERGADELSVRVLCAEGQGRRADDFEDAFEARQLPSDLRRVPFAPDDQPAGLVRLWRLDEEALSSLRTFLPDGLFTHRIDPHGWLEDPMLFREGQLMLGIVTHEREGVLRVTPEELRELERVGFDFAHEASTIRF